MQAIKELFSASAPMDSATALRKREQAGHKLADGRAELERVTADVDRLKLQRARLLEQQDSDGVDLYPAIRKAEGALASALRRRDELADRVRVREEQLAVLDNELRQARQREAPARMLELSAQHRELLADVRVGMAQAISALRAIPPIEEEGLQLQREFSAPPAKTTPVSYFAQDALQTLEGLNAKFPPPFEEATPVDAPEKLRQMEERLKQEQSDFLRYGGRGPRYDETVDSGEAMVLNPRLALSREMGTAFMGAEHVTEAEAATIRKEMEAGAAR